MISTQRGSSKGQEQPHMRKVEALYLKEKELAFIKLIKAYALDY
jgi:hypothetical protein